MAVATPPHAPEDERRNTAARLVVVVAVVLAVIGAVVAATLVLTGRDSEPKVGAPVETGFGSFTVSRVSTAFVPSTQGPPTMAKMMGTTGTGRLQVWVTLVNTEVEEGVRFAPDQLRLITADGKSHEPDGSTLEAGDLPLGSSIDGQVWFELGSSQPKRSGHLVEFRTGDGTALQVPIQIDPVPEHGGHGPKGSDGSPEKGSGERGHEDGQNHQ